MCPHCGQNAPLVYRGVSAFCSACGKPRTPFTANAVNLRGKPAKIGGTVASVIGWVILFGSVAVALILGAILQAIFPMGAVVGWVVGGVIATVGIGIAMLLLFGGHALRRSGTQSAEAARRDALGTLASYHQGIVTAQNAAEALGIAVDQADAFLTSLAKQPDSGITLEVDDEGRITYRFARYAPQAAWPPPARVGQGTQLAPENMRVEAEPEPVQAPVPATARPEPAPAERPPRGRTEPMPQAQAVGPLGTMVVKSRPPQGIRIAEPEVVPAGDEEEEGAPGARRARS
jgi:hypothetical protein